VLLATDVPPLNGDLAIRPSARLRSAQRTHVLGDVQVLVRAV